MIIGNFTYDAKADTYDGTIATMTFSRTDVRLEPKTKAGAKEPHYRIVARTGNLELGAAWKRTSENGREFLSISLDDPSFARALNARLYPNEEGDTAALVWNRPKTKAKAD